MRIAVCLSGQPRTYRYTIDNIKNYFSDYDVDYFCHAWNYDTNKVKNFETNSLDYVEELVDVDDFKKSIIEKFQPKELIIDSADKLKNHRFPYYSLLYSQLMANHYKRQYENKNGFKYDYVIKARYDLVFNPQTKFKLDLRTLSASHHQLDIYTTHNERMAIEYCLFNPSDVIYYGSSIAMDICADLFWYIKYMHIPIDDMRMSGPGTLMSDYQKKSGLAFFRSDSLKEIIYRQSARGLNPNTDYDLIAVKHQEIYT